MNILPVVVIPADDPPLVGRSSYLDELRKIASVHYHDDRPDSESQMLQRLLPADVILNSRSAVKLSGEMLRQLPGLKMIAVCGIGYDAIDLAAATEHEIVVSNIPGRTATIVAEHAFAMMLAVARRLPSMTSSLRSGTWSNQLGTSLIGKRAGIIGTGHIGCEMIRLCRAFGMEVVAWSFHMDEEKSAALGFQYVSREELLNSSDVVSLHIRLSDDSLAMISAEQLSRMKTSAILVNTARAAVVNTVDLAAALQQGRLFGAAVDVYDQEPIKKDHPLLSCENVVLTPHSADQTPEGLDVLTKGCVENIRAFFNGHPTNVVN